MTIENLDYYKGKDMLASQDERGRVVDVKSLAVALSIFAKESDMTLAQLQSVVRDAFVYVPNKKPVDVEEVSRQLGF